MSGVRKVFTLTNLTVVIVVGYLYVVVNNLYTLMNPMASIIVDPDEDTVNPLWEKNQPFSLVCFLSHTPRFNQFHISKFEAQSKLLLHLNNLTFHNDEEADQIEMDINIEDSNYVNHGTSANTVLVQNSRIWDAVRNNRSAVFLHALTVKHDEDGTPPDHITLETLDSGQGAYGVINLIKYDEIPKSYRHRYLLTDWGYEGLGSEEEAARAALPSDTVVSYWKPEVAVRLVADFTLYPLHQYVPPSIYKNVVPSKYTIPPQHRRINSGIPSQKYYKPSFHADEIGLTSDKYLPLNKSVTSLPLKVSYEPMSLQRWLLMSSMQQSLTNNKEMGFSDKDLDDVRRLISDTSLSLLGVTFLASVLHMLFEALAFQSDIHFWRDNKSMTGLSARTLVTDLISQFIIFLFLVDSETSLLVIIPSGCGIVIQLWKVWKATGISFKNGRAVYTRLESSDDSDDEDTTEDNGKGVAEDRSEDKVALQLHAQRKEQHQFDKELAAVTLAADRVALLYLGLFFVPLVVGFSAFTLIMHKHLSWYSWLLTTLTTCVYTGGFVLMCPQLFINHKLKSVAHLPWKLLCFRFVNTFIDDLFAFIIKMPAMHRMSVFRDDFVFLVYMYQRYIYRIDESRPMEK